MNLQTKSERNIQNEFFAFAFAAFGMPDAGANEPNGTNAPKGARSPRSLHSVQFALSTSARFIGLFGETALFPWCPFVPGVMPFGREGVSHDE